MEVVLMKKAKAEDIKMLEDLERSIIEKQKGSE
jgi:hypothetical protein